MNKPKQTLTAANLAKMSGQNAVRQRHAVGTSPQPKSKPKNA